MARETAEKTQTIQSVVMALEVLETVANAKGELGVTALAAALDTTKSRIHRHLRTLLALGYISQSEDSERYRIGARLIALGQAASGSADISSVAIGHMRDLRDKTGHAVVLCRVEERGIRVLNTLPGKTEIDVGVKPGSLLGLCNSAQGKVALASMPEHKRDEFVPDVIPQTTKYTITDRDKFLAHLGTVAKQGWATAPNENMLGLNALASPIFNVEKEAIATVAIVSLTQYIETPPSKDQIEAVRLAARQVSAELGYTSDKV